MKGHGSGKSRPFGHVGESKGDLLLISVVDCFVDKEVELHGVEPMHGFVVGSIEHLGDTNA